VVEQDTFNVLVQGSSPCALTILLKKENYPQDFSAGVLALRILPSWTDQVRQIRESGNYYGSIPFRYTIISIVTVLTEIPLETTGIVKLWNLAA
jgi:hypothetical protein